MVIFSAAPFMGPALGPIVRLRSSLLPGPSLTPAKCGGFLGETAGWRWVAALLANSPPS